jgi:hypothetical protein
MKQYFINNCICREEAEREISREERIRKKGEEEK